MTKHASSSERRRTLGNRQQSFFGCWGRREETVLLEVATPLEATITIDEETAAKQKAQFADRLGLTDGSHLDIWRTAPRATQSPRKWATPGVPKGTRSLTNGPTDEPDAHGVEWLNFTDSHGIVRKRRFPLPRSRANFKRDFLGEKIDGDP